jgi:hypothetical protein
MIFPTRDIEGDKGTIKAWTPLPNAREWAAFRRMIMAGTLVEVPDHLLSEGLKPKPASKGRGRPRKRVDK